jgi:Holliday junction resolvase RusA-like endonuclease
MTAFVIDLPCPPSKNETHGYGNGRVFRSPAYKKWINEADAVYFMLGLNKGRTPITSKFDLTIYYSPQRMKRMDPQNIVDASADWIQHAGIVENDRHLRRLKLEPGDIAKDVRLIVEPA